MDAATIVARKGRDPRGKRARSRVQRDRAWRHSRAAKLVSDHQAILSIGG
jgi:hypothetical protein